MVVDEKWSAIFFSALVVFSRVWGSILDSVVGDSSFIWVVVSSGSATVVSVTGGSVVVDEKWSAIFLSALVVFVRVWGSILDSVVGDSSFIWVVVSSGSATVVSVIGGSVVVDEKWSAIFLSALVVFVRVWGPTLVSVVGDSSSIWVVGSSGSATVMSITRGSVVVDEKWSTVFFSEPVVLV